MQPTLKSLLELSHSFAGIDRDIFYPRRERPENDAEHVFQISLLAWHIIEKNNLDLDQAKVFKLCIAHDLVEVYAGDVPFWGKSGHEEKVEREKAALERLKIEFSQNPDMTNAIEEYKARQTPEAIFVYAVDKLAPFLNQLLSEGRAWKTNQVTIDRVIEVLGKQSKISEHLTQYFEEGIELMKSQQELYFGQ